MKKLTINEIKGLFFDIRDSLESYGYIVGNPELRIGGDINAGIAGSSYVIFEKSFGELHRATRGDNNTFFTMATELFEEGHYYSIIELNQAAVDTGNPELLISLLLHEFCHILSDVQIDYVKTRFLGKTPANEGHTDLWQRHAREISKRFSLPKEVTQYTDVHYATEIAKNSKIIGTLKCPVCGTTVEFSDYAIHGEPLIVYDGMSCTECALGHFKYSGRTDGYTTLVLCYNKFGLLAGKSFDQVLFHIIPEVRRAIHTTDDYERKAFELYAASYIAENFSKVFSKQYAIIDMEAKTVKVLGGR